MGREASFYERRVSPFLRQTAKFSLYGLAIAYPIYLVYVGLVFGGLVFWTFFVGSMALVGAVITKLGYASNFRHWDISLRRTVSVFLAFALAAGFYAGIIYLRIWILLVVSGLLFLGLLFVLRRRKL